MANETENSIELSDFFNEEADFTITRNGKRYKFRHKLGNNTEDHAALDARNKLLSEKHDAIVWEGEGDARIPRVLSDLDRDKIKEITDELEMVLPKLICLRLVSMPFKVAGKPLELTPEAVAEHFKYNMAALDNIIAWSNAARYPKPLTANG
jgi:hypothetical protein